ncbi:hypothetical protein PENSPDRAFT_716509 [Peniophora sp. CONT]|nr:hypothetical protein PENSPDRAFT_716509 [Peniophora sp. CONT]
MRLSTVFGLSALSAAPAVLANARHGSNARRHHDLANRQETGVIEKRGIFSNAKFTWYDIGVAQCGWHNENDFVVAINAIQYGSYWKSDYCGKQISITLNGKTATATVVDECMGCPYAGLDFSKGLFEYFSDVGAGIIYGDWHFIDGSDSGSGSDNSATTSTKQAAATSTKIQVKASSKATTSEAAWTPTTTWQPATTSKAPETTKEPETTWKAPESTSEAPASTWVPTTSAKPSSTEKAATSSAEPTTSASAKQCAVRKRSVAPAHIPARRVAAA